MELQNGENKTTATGTPPAGLKPESLPVQKKDICDIAVDAFNDRYLNFDCNTNKMNPEELESYVIDIIIDAENAKETSNGQNLEKRRENLRNTLSKLSSEEFATLKEKIVQKFTTCCKDLHKALVEKQLNSKMLRGLTVTQRLALFNLGIAHGENSEWDIQNTQIIEHLTIMDDQNYKKAYYDVIKSISQKPLTNRWFATNHNPVMDLVEAFKKADEKFILDSSSKDWNVINGHLGTFMKVFLVLLECLRRFSNLFKTDTSDLFQASSAADKDNADSKTETSEKNSAPTWLQQEMSEILNEAWKDLPDKYSNVTFQVFCRIMERRVTTLMQGVVLKYHQLLHKTRVHQSKE